MKKAGEQSLMAEGVLYRFGVVFVFMLNFGYFQSNVRKHIEKELFQALLFPQRTFKTE